MENKHTYLVVTDLHLTDKAKDAYRWELFQWITRTILKYHATDLLILGDLCNEKDKHSATLVKKVVDTFSEILEHTGVTIHILKGNHDYSRDEANPFFSFLNKIPRINFYIFPTVVHDKLLFLPNSKFPEKDWANFNFGEYEYVFLHQGFVGALTSTGFELESGATQEMLRTVKPTTKVFSGDIHVPQTVGRVTYIGTPYPINHNDDYECRALLIENGEEKDLHFASIHKHTIDITGLEDLKNLDIQPGDHVKIRIHLRDSELDTRVSKKIEITEAMNAMGIVISSVNTIVNKESNKNKPIIKNHSVEELIQEFGTNEHLEPGTIQLGKILSRKEN